MYPGRKKSVGVVDVNVESGWTIHGHLGQSYAVKGFCHQMAVCTCKCNAADDGEGERGKRRATMNHDLGSDRLD